MKHKHLTDNIGKPIMSAVALFLVLAMASCGTAPDTLTKDATSTAASTSAAKTTASEPTAEKAQDYGLPYILTYDFAVPCAGFAEGTLTLSKAADTDLTLAYSVGGEPYNACDVIGVIPAGADAFGFSSGSCIPSGADGVIVLSGGETVGRYDFPESKTASLGEAYFTFASVADIHLNYNELGLEATRKWRDALKFFVEKEIGYVMVCGDITGEAERVRYSEYRSSIKASGFDPTHVYEARGNHDSQDITRFLKYTASEGDEEIRPYEDSPYFYVLFDGGDHRDNLFIFMAQELTAISNTPNEDNFSDAQIAWLRSLLETYAGTETNIFILEHALMHNFGPGDRYDGVYVQPIILDDRFPNNLAFKQLLVEYKEAIMMSGHTHLSLYEGVNYSDEDGTAARMIHNSSVSQPRLYAPDGASISYDANGQTSGKYGSEAYLAYIYDSCVTYVGYNLSTGKIIPMACFILPLYSEDRNAVSITVTKQPTKAEYTAGEFFDPRGLEITAKYADGTEKPVKGWSVERTASLTADTSSVTIRYGSVTAEVGITVK